MLPPEEVSAVVVRSRSQSDAHWVEHCNQCGLPPDAGPRSAHAVGLKRRPPPCHPGRARRWSEGRNRVGDPHLGRRRTNIPGTSRSRPLGNLSENGTSGSPSSTNSRTNPRYESRRSAFGSSSVSSRGTSYSTRPLRADTKIFLATSGPDLRSARLLNVWISSKPRSSRKSAISG